MAGTAAAEAAAERRRRIVGAAFGLFVAHGYDRTTTRQIAAGARVSKRDLYALFGDKAAILAACFAERAAEMSRPLRLPTPTDRAALGELLAGFGRQLIADLAEPTTVAAYRLAIAEAERAPEVAAMLHAAGQMPVRAAVVELLRRCVEGGLLRGDPAQLALRYFTPLRLDSMLLHLLLRQPPDAAEPSPAERAAAAARAVLATDDGMGQASAQRNAGSGRA